MTLPQELDERGFAVIAGPVPPERLPRLAHAYDAVMATATGADRDVCHNSPRSFHE